MMEFKPTKSLLCCQYKGNEIKALNKALSYCKPVSKSLKFKLYRKIYCKTCKNGLYV